MEVRIRRGRRTDYECLAAFGAWPGVEREPRRSIRLYRRIIADPGADLYVADDGGEAIGLIAVSYARVLSLGGQRAMIEELVVRADRRGAGVGSQLLRFAMGRARRRAVRVVRAIAPDDPARRLFEREGFRSTTGVCEWGPEEA